jgi:hypothetical protein
MLNTGDHCRSATRVQIILLDGVVAPHGEEGRSRAIVGDGGNVIDSRHTLIRYPLSTNIPCACLTIGE